MEHPENTEDSHTSHQHCSLQNISYTIISRQLIAKLCSNFGQNGQLLHENVIHININNMTFVQTIKPYIHVSQH